AVSPVGSWPPARFADWAGAVQAAACRWDAWVEDRRVPFPALLSEEWSALRAGEKLGLEELARGEDARVRQALLTLHAIADETCAGLGVAIDASDGTACVYRARGRELLARTGSLSRVNPRLLRALPNLPTPPTRR